MQRNRDLIRQLLLRIEGEASTQCEFNCLRPTRASLHCPAADRSFSWRSSLSCSRAIGLLSPPAQRRASFPSWRDEPLRYNVLQFAPSQIGGRIRRNRAGYRPLISTPQGTQQSHPLWLAPRQADQSLRVFPKRCKGLNSCTQGGKDISMESHLVSGEWIERC